MSGSLYQVFNLVISSFAYHNLTRSVSLNNAVPGQFHHFFLKWQHFMERNRGIKVNGLISDAADPCKHFQYNHDIIVNQKLYETITTNVFLFITFNILPQYLSSLTRSTKHCCLVITCYAIHKDHTANVELTN
jgi:hypothetical protein